MQYDFLIFGGTGLQGRICARDLLESGYSVLLAGRDPGGISDLLENKKAGFESINLTEEAAIPAVIRKSEADVVVNCAELVFNIPIMKACLKTERSCTDLGGLQDITREQFKLDSAFRKKGLLTITGCGSTPGIVNVMAAHGLKQLGSVEAIKLGFAWDSNIKTFVVPYSMQSIFYEFTQPPVIFRDGRFVKGNRIECLGTFDFKEVGRQTVYCIVHSEVYTFSRYFKHKGIGNVHYMAGFPEHSLKAIQALIDLGFHSPNKIVIDQCTMSPLDFTIRALKQLPIPRGYREVENLWVKVDGTKRGKGVITEMNCIVKTVKGWESAGTNVGTGRTISIMSQMLKRGLIPQTGVYAPEAVIPPDLFFKELAMRKMYVYQDGERIN
ncbi:saccharopine dehydrogenase NADP-binding domain-containing protein [bacterium]|nr:saccharopine dehydrogenase NADP-binding domain-containing protein [bacterium]MCI0605709.1 saccharopine dehydrogenase NADP-binding domain-containing protein [bacterium]